MRVKSTNEFKNFKSLQISLASTEKIRERAEVSIDS